MFLFPEMCFTLVAAGGGCDYIIHSFGVNSENSPGAPGKHGERPCSTAMNTLPFFWVSRGYDTFAAPPEFALL